MKRPGEEEPQTYNLHQRLAYLTVVFLLFPLMIWTGLAMSPSITSVFSILVIALHGQQSARTIQFFIVTDTLKNVRDGLGASGPAIGYSWYGGIRAN
jgi:thiosulfate reductase cytochrome b subunit